jgi:hypothetical protein
MCHVRTTIPLAKGVGEGVGRGEILFGPLSRRGPATRRLKPGGMTFALCRA